MDYTSSQAECSSGTGRFFLLPILYNDMDKDGNYSVVFTPIQQSGTGVMTRQAWISSISPVNLPSGSQMKVVKQTPSFRFTSTDALENASSIATSITGTTNFDSQVLRGDPPFTVEEMALSNLGAYTVDMTWSCGSGGTTRTLPQGYQFRLSSIGCSGNQKFTLRYATSPNRVYLEPYGNPSVSSVEPTTTTSTGQAFVFEHNGIVLDATIISTNSTHAVVRIDEISVDGVDQCTPGTYTFEVE